MVGVIACMSMTNTTLKILNYSTQFRNSIPFCQECIICPYSNLHYQEAAINVGYLIDSLLVNISTK